MLIKLIPDWQRAWRFWSVQLSVLMALIAALEGALPQIEAVLPAGWFGWVALLVAVARVIEQKTRATT